MKIVISSGHGKYIRGASGSPVPPQLDEVDEARKVVDQVAVVLRGMGVETITFHDNTSHDQSTNLSTIVNFHNKQTRDYDVSVHFNAYDGKAHGAEVLYKTQEKLAKTVVDKICGISGLTNRGPKYRGDLKFLNSTEEPAILVETCFCDSTSDSNTYREHFSDICTAIAEGISGRSAQPGPGPDPEPPTPEPPTDPGTLEGKPLRYLIGGDDTATGADNEVIELSYDAERLPARGIGVKYGNLFNEKYADQSPAQRARYAPYLEQGDTAEEYNEGQIDPSGQGWNKNLDEQISRAMQQGFTIIEWDNPDSYGMADVLNAVGRAHAAGLKVLAKNPGICSGSKAEYVRHAAVVGIVVEEDCGEPSFMEAIRVEAGKSTLPVWFVAYGHGRDWADNVADKISIGGYSNMGVTYSTVGEYGNSTDILLPNTSTSPEPGPTPPSPDEERKTIGKGDKGPDVVELQTSLGVLKPDGDFGSITDTWVKAFQAACGLTADGIVGPKTWEQVDELDERVIHGEPPLPKELHDQIYTMAQQSEIAEYSWPDRGVAPPGYIAGMALSFAVAFRRAEEGDDAVDVMVQSLESSNTDALKWYERELADKQIRLGTPEQRLRALFVLMICLGPRESSGKYCEGRDMSASNVASDTCEAGLFQTSWNIRNGDTSIAPLLDEFWDNPNGFLDVFKENISPTANNLNSYGSGDGIKYQWLSRFCPLFHVFVTAVGLRVLKDHWGPVKRKELTIKKEADDLLKAVQDLVAGVA